MRGRYIVLEGIEGAGKTTIADAVADAIRRQGREVLTVREPGGTAIGEALRELLLHQEEAPMNDWVEAMLFAAARSQLASEVIGPALAAGTWVVADRSVYSSLAYQGAGRGLGVEKVRAVNAAGLADVWPERVILLRLDPALGLERQQVADRIGAEGVEFQATVAEAYERMAATEPDRFAVVDAADAFDDVVSAVVEAASA